MIYRLFTGNHIDLDKVVDLSVPEMVFDTFPSCRGVHARFEITFQLMDDKKVYTVMPESHETQHEGRELLRDGIFIHVLAVEQEGLTPDLLTRTQEGVDRLIAVWKEYKNFKST